MKTFVIAVLALIAASPALAQFQPGPNIINGRPVTIGPNGRPLGEGPQSSCGYGQALFSLIETTASRLDPEGFANQAGAKNAVIAAVSDEFERRKATRDWFGFTWKQSMFTPGHMLASAFDADLNRQCFPRFAKLLNDMVLVQQQRQVQEAKVRAEREAAEAQRKAEHQAKMAEIERQQAEERRTREAAEAQRRAEAAAEMAVIEQKRRAENRQRDEAEAKAMAERAAEEAKGRAEHEAKMAEIERERQAAVARVAAERAEQWRASVQAAWKVPFLLNTNISEDLFKAVENEVGSACGRKIKNLVTYDIRSPGTFYGTNSGNSALLRFTRWQVRVSQTGTITIRGDDAEAQNGFGTWLKVNYSCEVDLASKKIVNVSIDPGRLPDPTN
jgi:hypothetical protein